jgi:hypothetical protein
MMDTRRFALPFERAIPVAFSGTGNGNRRGGRHLIMTREAAS